MPQLFKTWTTAVLVDDYPQAITIFRWGTGGGKFLGSLFGILIWSYPIGTPVWAFGGDLGWWERFSGKCPTIGGAGVCLPLFRFFTRSTALGQPEGSIV